MFPRRQRSISGHILNMLKMCFVGAIPGGIDKILSSLGIPVVEGLDKGRGIQP